MVWLELKDLGPWNSLETQWVKDPVLPLLWLGLLLWPNLIFGLGTSEFCGSVQKKFDTLNLFLTQKFLSFVANAKYTDPNKSRAVYNGEKGKSQPSQKDKHIPWYFIVSGSRWFCQGTIQER